MQDPKIPKYRRHHAGGRDRAFVELGGQRDYIGRYNSPESVQHHEQLVAEWLHPRRSPEASGPRPNHAMGYPWG